MGPCDPQLALGTSFASPEPWCNQQKRAPKDPFCKSEVGLSPTGVSRLLEHGHYFVDDRLENLIGILIVGFCIDEVATLRHVLVKDRQRTSFIMLDLYGPVAAATGP